MAEVKLLKAGGSGSDFSQFASTDTIPASALPAASAISPSQITGDQDNYAPTGWDTADVVRLDFDTGGRAITGFAAWTNTRQKRILNISANYGYIPCEHPDSTAANRVIGVCDHIIAPYGSLLLEYDSTSSRIRVVANSFDFSPAGFCNGKMFVHRESVGATLGTDWGTIGFGISGGNNGTNIPTSSLPGAWEINTSTSTTGTSSLYFAKTINQTSYFGSAHMISVAYVYFGALSDATDTYTFSHGIVSSATNTALNINNSVVIKYSHGLNSGKLLGVSRDNAGAESTVDLGTTVAANTPYVLAVCYDKARSEARFYVDGVYAGRVTGNMPTSTAAADRTVIVKSAGTASKSVFVASKLFTAIY